MVYNLNMVPNFDPLIFLGLSNIKAEDKEKLSQELLEQISKYLAARILELLPEDRVENLTNYDDLLIVTQNKIPGIDEKVKGFLEDFRAEFKKNLSKYE